MSATAAAVSGVCSAQTSEVIASLALFFAGPVLWSNGGFQVGAAVVVMVALWAQLKLRWSVLQVIGAAAALGVAMAVARQVLS